MDVCGVVCDSAAVVNVSARAVRAGCHRRPWRPALNTERERERERKREREREGEGEPSTLEGWRLYAFIVWLTVPS